MVTPGAPNWRSGLGPLLARTCTVSGAKGEEEEEEEADLLVVGVGEIKREGKEALVQDIAGHNVNYLPM